MARVMIAAIKSGSGKTSITCGLLSAFKNLGRNVASLKCGPDYIDPMFHKRILGISSGNLDPYFSDGAELRNIVREAETLRSADALGGHMSSADESAERNLLFIEGVMGIYDGIGGLGSRGSTYEAAQKTDTPIVLILDAAGMGNTVVSILKGILADDEAGLIRGVIFNRMSAGYYRRLLPLLESAFLHRRLRFLGAVPRLRGAEFESRHLGLMLPGEIEVFEEMVARYERAVSESVDLTGLANLAEGAAGCAGGGLPAASETDVFAAGVESAPERADCRPLTLAVAWDEAFCFYYDRNLREFEKRGVRLERFSPLRDDALPEGSAGLLLGGGYPELYARELSENEAMRSAVAEAIGGGMPSLAECGGFLYLFSEIVTAEGSFPMAGVLPGRAEDAGHPVRFGYCELTGEKGLMKDLSVRCHEYHYYDVEKPGMDCSVRKPGGGAVRPAMYCGKRHLWGFLHLYYPSCTGRTPAAMPAPAALADRFVRQMEEYLDE